ncbi:protein translocase subunit SecDF [Bacteroidota bacterium]
MRNKGAIKVFAIALVLVSLYQLSFTVATNKVAKNAEKYVEGKSYVYANSDPSRIQFQKDSLKQYYKDSLSDKEVYNFLGLRKFKYSECLDREFNLGLDLQGGMNVIMEVSVVDVISVLATDQTDPLFVQTMARAKELQRDSQEEFVDLFRQAFEEIDPNAQLASLFSSIELEGQIDYNSTNSEVINLIRTKSDEAIANTKKILRERVDRFGVSQTSFQELSGGRVLIAMPGIDEPERVKKLLQSAAKLEFWETYDNDQNFYGYLQQANDLLRERAALLGPQEDSIASTNEDTNLIDKLNQPADTTGQESLIDQLGEDSTGLTDPAVDQEKWNRENPLFAILIPMISPNPNGQGYSFVDGASIGMSLPRDRERVMSLLNDPRVKELFPRDVKFYWDVKPSRFSADIERYELIAIKVTNRDGLAALDGEVVTDARQTFTQTGLPEVSIVMDRDGSQIWQRLTRDNINKQIAIVLDDLVYSHPNVNSEIAGGRSVITGSESVAEAKDLANVLESGKMRAPATIIQDSIVGPSLGKEARTAGLLSFAIAFAIVLLYMMFYYNRAGVVANIALILNVFFILGVLASLGATLTLPGIAGIVLTIGMSVDANVLIYERIREELAAGKGLKLALKDGYKNAYSAIIDANVTTVLTGIILYTFGTGPIQGFAVTLIIGIFTSLFAAIFITRLIFTWLLDKDKKLNFSTKLTEGAFKNLNINFLKRRKLFYVISGIIILIGLGSSVVRKWDLGVDFSGGRSYIVRFDHNIPSSDVGEALTGVFESRPEVKTYGSGDDMVITTKYLHQDEGVLADSLVLNQLFEGLKGFFTGGITYENFISEETLLGSEKVGATISDDIRRSAVISITFALIVIFIYILVRFRNWQYGLGAIAALAHDVLILLGIFSLFYGIVPFSLEINQAFIAAILTVIGYSINDTVVVFDRVREYSNLYKKRDKESILNLALNSTLSRTFSTSLSTFFVLLAIFLFGGVSIRGFIFAMMIGVVVGTYSSLFIASPIVYDLRTKIIDKVVAKKLKN